MSATTAIPTYIRHIRDRPPWQKEQVWIMDTGFHPALWQDESACRLHRLLAGSFETLRQYGTRQESASTGNAPPLEGVPGSALVYVDSKLLHACELVDLPGIRCG